MATVASSIRNQAHMYISNAMSTKLKREDRKIVNMMKDMDKRLHKLHPFYELVVEAYSEVEKSQEKNTMKRVTSTTNASQHSRSNSRRMSRRSSV